ncbi:MAG: hypothetical protein GXO99_01070 [Nitrospirae bacterium]|nr:hypothetical protein [Nitrospirota bacterium]
MKRFRNLTITAIIITILLFGVTVVAFAWPSKRWVTPYGDYCPMASIYGMQKHNISVNEAKHALSQYYSKKGYSIIVVDIKGRFMKINVMDGKRVIDTIIFDRHTGRIRSIY